MRVSFLLLSEISATIQFGVKWLPADILKTYNATKTHKVTSKSQDEDGWNRAVEIHGAVIITEKTVS